MERFIVRQVKDTIDMFSSRLPNIYEKNSEQQYVAIFWKLNLNQDYLWDMFVSKRKMEKYFDDIKYFFDVEYENYELGIKIDNFPVNVNNKLYGRVILYYYLKDYYANSNTHFIS